MTFTEAAALVLRQVGKPLHYKEITDVAIDKNLLSHVGKSPEVTMGARLAALVKKGDKDNPLVRVKPGVFALREWDQKTLDEGLADRTPALEILAGKDIEEPATDEEAETEEDDLGPEDDDAEEPILAEDEPGHGGAADLDGEEPPPDEDELSRAEIAAAAGELFEPEDDDDEPIFGGPTEEEVEDEDRDDAEARGRRRRRRRRRGRGGSEEKGGDDLPSYTVSDAPAEVDVEELRESRPRERERSAGDRQQSDRQQGERQQSDRQQSDRQQGDRQQGDRQQGDRQQSDRQQGDRQGSEELSGQPLADALAALLAGYDRNAGPVALHKLAEGLQRKGRISREGNHAQALLAATARADNLRRAATGQRGRFRLSNNRVWLTDWLLDSDLLKLEREVQAAVERYREAARRSLLRRMQELPQRTLGELVWLALESAGLSSLSPTKRPGAPPFELHLSGNLTTPTGEVPVAVVIRRDGREVGRERVTELRGALHHYGPATAGWIVTTGQVLSGAREEARALGAAPITLIDGPRLAKLCEEHGIGVTTTQIGLPVLDAELLEALRGG